MHKNVSRALRSRNTYNRSGLLCSFSQCTTAWNLAHCWWIDACPPVMWRLTQRPPLWIPTQHEDCVEPNMPLQWGKACLTESVDIPAETSAHRLEWWCIQHTFCAPVSWSRACLTTTAKGILEWPRIPRNMEGEAGGMNMMESNPHH